jgi:glycosyltransferase involved in cell wall biosynthesis
MAMNKCRLENRGTNGLRILIVSQYFWPESFRINDLAKSLKQDFQCDVTVLTGMPNYPQGNFFSGYGLWGPAHEMLDGINIYRVPLIPRGNGSNLRLALNYLSFAGLACLFGPARCRGPYDLIFVAQYSPVTVALPAILLKMIHKAPMFLWVQDLWPESISATGAIQSRWILRAVERLVAFIYRQSDRILVQSRAFISHIRPLSGEEAAIDYLPNWAEELYRPCVPDVPWGESKGLPAGFRVMFAGNIGAAQDFATILSAAERLREQADIQWVILGDGSARNWVEQEIERRKLAASVHLMGRHSVEEMPRFFALADALLVTLKKEPIFALTIPSKVQSYLACARPVVAALEGEGSRVVEESGAGLTCCPEDPEQLASIVLQLYGMTAQERETMGSKGRKYYEENFERRRLIERLVMSFREAQAKRSG